MRSEGPNSLYKIVCSCQARRWSREYRNLLIREELTSLQRVENLGNLELLMLRLPELVGAPLSLNAIREDLRLSQLVARCHFPQDSRGEGYDA